MNGGNLQWGQPEWGQPGATLNGGNLEWGQPSMGTTISGVNFECEWGPPCVGQPEGNQVGTTLSVTQHSADLHKWFFLTRPAF